MSCSLPHHRELTNGVGKCSVPMWQWGLPAGFCDEPAYGKRPEGKTFYNAHSGEQMRLDGKYNGYVPGLACPRHGGPDRPTIDPKITAKNGLLYRDGEIIELPEADRVASEHGFACAEQLVRHLQPQEIGGQ